MIGGTFPSITAAQIVAFAAAIISVLVSFGVDISEDQQNSMLLLTGIVCAALIAGDAGLRASRNVRAGRENAAAGLVTTPSLGDVAPAPVGEQPVSAAQVAAVEPPVVPPPVTPSATRKR